MAATLAGLGCTVTLAGLIGTDDEGARLRQSLRSEGVQRLSLVERPVLQTITKTRILSDTYRQLIRLDRDGHRAHDAEPEQELLAEALGLVDDQGAVVLADYDKGAITPRVARTIIPSPNPAYAFDE